MCVCVCVRACVRVGALCERACVRVCACVCVCVCALFPLASDNVPSPKAKAHDEGDGYGDDEYLKHMAQQAGQSSVELDIQRERDREVEGGRRNPAEQLLKQLPELKKVAVESLDRWSSGHWADQHAWSAWPWGSGHDEGWDQGWSSGSWSSRNSWSYDG